MAAKGLPAAGAAMSWAPLLYIGTGIAQPLLTDAVKYRGGAGSGDGPATLVPLLAHTLGMTLVVQLADLAGLRNGGGGGGRGGGGGGGARRGGHIPAEVFAKATAIDLASGILTTSGLLLVGSGIYTVIYSSTTAWTAVISYVTGTSALSSGQWLGVALVTLGLGMNALGVLEDSSGDTPEHIHTLLLGCALLLLGTVFHAGAFVFNERAIKRVGVPPFLLCASIGSVEAALVTMYNAVLVLNYDVQELYLEPIEAAGGSVASVLALYAGLVLAHALHALSFFAMLGHLGAVTTGILKSILAVSVFTFAAAMFCSYEASQCFSPFKAAAMVIVLFGSFVFRLASQQVRELAQRKSAV